jgi:hypothetical protein
MIKIIRFEDNPNFLFIEDTFRPRLVCKIDHGIKWLFPYENEYIFFKIFILLFSKGLLLEIVIDIRINIHLRRWIVIPKGIAYFFYKKKKKNNSNYFLFSLKLKK